MSEVENLVAQLHPVEELYPENRQRLAQKAQIAPIKAGEKFNAAAEHRWLLYLLEGRMGILSNGKTETFDASSARAKQPIFSDMQLKDQAVSGATGRLLRLDRNLYETLIQHQHKDGYEIEDVELTETENQLFLQIYQACMSKTLDLPALPDVAAKIQATVYDSDVDVNTLSRLIQLDLGITAGLLQAANSAIYGGGQSVLHVRDAVVRLGLDATRRLVLSIALEKLFMVDSPALKHYIEELWENSVHISAISYVIARHCNLPGLDPEHAMLAGLLCDIGELPVLDYIHHQGIDVALQEIIRITAKLHDMVGEMVVNSWGLGADISQVVRESRKWYRETKHGKADYCDIVLVSRLYRHLQKKGHTDLPRYDDVPAFSRLKLEKPEDPFKLKVLDQAEEEIVAIMKLLQRKA